MKRFFLVFLLIIFFLSPAPFSFSSKYIVIKKRVNVRVDSTITSFSLGYLLKGEIVEVIKEKYDWYKITLPPRFNCFIFKEFTEKIGADKIKVIASEVNLRSSPSLEAFIIGKSPKGAVFPLVEELDQWVKIQGYPYLNGWVHKKLLKKQDDQQTLSLLVKEIMPKLSEPDIRKKEENHQKLVEKGEEIIPFLEEYIPDADANISYSIISILTQLGENNPSLVKDFLEKADTSSIRAASIYLDVAQNVIQPKNLRVGYFYLAQKGKLSLKEIKEARDQLQKAYKRKTEPHGLKAGNF